MSEADTKQPPAHADDPGEPVAGFGCTLSQSRLRAGLSLEQAAARLRLHPRQLRALESEDLTALPAPAYAAGFVRNYARELKIDPAPLVEDLNAKLRISGLGMPVPDLGLAAPAPSRVLDDRAWRRLVLAGIVIGLACAGLIGTRIVRSGIQPDGVTPSARRPPATEAARNTEPQAIDTAAAPSARPSAMPDSAGATKSATAETILDPGTLAGTPAAPGAVLAPTSMPAGAVPVAASAPARGAGEAPRVPVAALSPAPGATTGLVLRFNDRSWVEVSQPDGRILLSRNDEPGSIELLNVAAPLVLVVGRPEAVQVEYRGRTVDLKPYVSANGVARLMLADDRVTRGGKNNP
jgi:cytoskeleton protein RodZ